MTRVFLDTNVLVYLFDHNSPAKQARAQDVVLLAHDFVVSTQVMLEFYSVVTRKFDPPVPADEGAELLAELKRWEVVSADAAMVIAAAQAASAHQLSIWDAMVLEAARFAGCSELWTEDFSHGATVRDVRLVNPFEGIQ